MEAAFSKLNSIGTPSLGTSAPSEQLGSSIPEGGPVSVVPSLGACLRINEEVCDRPCGAAVTTSDESGV